ncbi:ATP phosphoribosyltransferase, partial [Kibdelosporangium lantanae]
GDPICVSEAVLVHRAGVPVTAEEEQLKARLQGVVFAQQYMMLDYDCPKDLLAGALDVTPGLESPTVAPLANPDWVAVRAMVPRKQVNPIMDTLSALGAKAILASDIRSCRL